MEATVRDAVRWLVAEIWRDGGQRGAKRNVWQAMAADSVRARDRAEAVALLDSLHGPRTEDIDRQEPRPA